MKFNRKYFLASQTTTILLKVSTLLQISQSYNYLHDVCDIAFITIVHLVKV